MSKEFMMNEVIELEEEIQEARKHGYITDSLEKLKAEYLEKLGEFDREEAERNHRNNVIDTANYMASMWA